MRVIFRFCVEHFEFSYKNEEGRRIWAHLVSDVPVEKCRVERLIEGFKCIIHQYGCYHAICVQSTTQLEVLRKMVEIEETAAGVWLADSVEFVDYCSRNPAAEDRAYLVSDSLFRQMSESFITVDNVPFESVIQHVAKQQGLHYVLIE